MSEEEIERLDEKKRELRSINASICEPGQQEKRSPLAHLIILRLIAAAAAFLRAHNQTKHDSLQANILNLFNQK